jgi:hypothetical protein
MPDTGRDWDWWTDVISALLLGLAAVASGWAAYQSALWGGEQTFALNESNSADREAATLETRSGQLRAMDLGVFIQYLQAFSRKDKQLADFLYQRFRPEMKPAVDAWLATRPLLNPEAPRSPFVMEEYHLHIDDEAREYDRSRLENLKAAQIADKNSDRYVLMTVPFAIVSLLSGMCTKFRLLRVRIAVLGLAFILFIVAAVILAFLPRAA